MRYMEVPVRVRRLDSQIERVQSVDRQPELKEMGLLDLASVSNVTYVPGFDFRGFHPDLAYVTRDGAVVKSPLDN